MSRPKQKVAFNLEKGIIPFVTDRIPSLETLGYYDVVRKNELAVEMFRELCQNLATQDSFAPNEAVDIGGRLVAYMAEAILHNEDRITLEYEDGTISERDLMKNYNLPWIHTERLEAEKVLAEALKGDFRELRTLLLYWNTYRVLPEWRPKLSQLAMSIPDHGPPFVLPMPAWLLKESDQITTE